MRVYISDKIPSPDSYTDLFFNINVVCDDTYSGINEPITTNITQQYVTQVATNSLYPKISTKFTN